MTETEVCSPKAMDPDLLTLRVDCSSSIIGKADIHAFTSHLSEVQTKFGGVFQWTFVIAGQAQASHPVNSNGDCGDPYQGPECCVTLKASNSESTWPRTANCTVPSVVAELILVSGTSIGDADLQFSLKEKVFDAIQKKLCPRGQKVWISVTSRQITDGAKFSHGVGP